MATTPSPAADLPQTPPAPRHGAYYDSWEPYSPRKSARISERNTNRTPSPRASRHPSSPRKNRADQESPEMSPRKKRQPAADSVRRASGPLTAEGTAKAAAALGLKPKSEPSTSKATASSSAIMLLTPTKTPRKPAATSQADIDTFKRNLFGSEDDTALSSRTRRPKKYSGLTMESFTAETIEEPIAIFTDSQDRVPVKDDSLSNPFYGDSAPTAEPARRRNKQKMVRVPGVGMQTLEEAARRDDGMLCSFRGKTFFRPYSQVNDDDEEEADSTTSAHLTRPLSRSAIKPRRLFQSEKPAPSIEDEEAATDVEDLHEGELEAPETPSRVETGREKTPEAPKFGPVSPPATKRTTRSMNKLADDTPIKASRQSPFESWRIAKKNVKAPRTVKRQGDDLAQEQQTKRARA
ncbi:unnamed protein product [Clonostachys chloroleuca]|uniref:Uncharacterized protein n=1 Tax=Clonostachys chloroleuca TaxID=1926264 RepID=A0AA35MJ09_9HYPO|nr:unnamed protein product [Clonostachys chloroleuca]